MKKMGMKSYAVAQAGDPFDDDRPRLLTSESAWKNTARTAGRKLLQDDLLDGKVPLSNADLVASVGWGHLVDDGSWTAAMGVYEALKPGILVMSSSAPGEAECLSCWGAPNSRRCREVMDTLGAERLRSGTNLSLPSPLQGERYPLQWIDGLFQENLELSLQWTAALRDNLIGRAVLLGEKLPEFKGLYKRNAKGNEDVDLSAGVPGRITDAPPTDTAEHSDAELEGFTGGLPEGLPAEEISAEDRAGIFMSASRVAEWLKLVYLAKNVLVMRRFNPSETVDAQFALDESFGFTSEMLHWFQPEVFARQIARAGAILRVNDTITLGDEQRAARLAKARRKEELEDALENQEQDGLDAVEATIEGEIRGLEEEDEDELPPATVWSAEHARQFETTSRRIARRWVLEEARSYRSLVRVQLEKLLDKVKFVQKALEHAYPHTIEDPESEPSQLRDQLQSVPEMLSGMMLQLKDERSRLSRLVNQAHRGVVGLEEEEKLAKENEERAKEQEEAEKEKSAAVKARMQGKRPPQEEASMPGSTVDIPSDSPSDPSKATLDPDGGQTGGKAIKTLGRQGKASQASAASDANDDDEEDDEDGDDAQADQVPVDIVAEIETKLADVVDPTKTLEARIPSSSELARAFASGDMLSVHRLLLVGIISLERNEADWLGASIQASDSKGQEAVQARLKQLRRFAGDALHYLSQPNMTIGHLALADPWTRAAPTLVRLMRVTSGSVQQGLYDAAGSARAVSDLSGEPTAVAQLLLIYSMYNDARVNAEQLWPQRAGLADAWAHTQVALASSGAMAHPTFSRRLRETISEVIALRPRWANDRTQAVLNTLRTKASSQSKTLLKKLKEVAQELDPRAVVTVVNQFVKDASKLGADGMDILSKLDRAKDLAKSVVLDVTERASPPRVLGFVDRKGEIALSKHVPMHRQDNPLSAGLVQSTRPWLPAFAHRHEPHFLMPYAFPAAERLMRRSFAGHLMSLPNLDGVTNVYDTEWGSASSGSEGRKLLVISSQWKPLHSVHRNFAPMVGAVLGREPAPWGEKRRLGEAKKSAGAADSVFDSATLLFLESQQLSLADADPTLFDHARAVPANATAHDLVEAIQWARAQGFDAVFYPQVGMHAYDYLLAVHRIAPVQIATYGHSTTTDMPEIDFFIGSLEGELGTALLCGLKGGKSVMGQDKCGTAFQAVAVKPSQEDKVHRIEITPNATRYVVIPHHYKSESDEVQQQLGVALGPLRKTKETQRLAEASGVEQHGVRLGLVMAKAGESVLKEAALDPMADPKRPVYVGQVDEVRTVLDAAGQSPRGEKALAKSIIEQKYRQERNIKRDKSERLQLLGVGRAIVSAANRFSEHLLLVDGLAAAFEPAPGTVANRPAADYRPAFMSAGNSSSDASGTWDGSFRHRQQPRLPSELGGVMLAGGSRGDHDVLGDLLDGATDVAPRPEAHTLSEAAMYAGAPADRCVIVALAWTAVKMNADHLAMIGDAMRMATDLRNASTSSPCTILRVFPGLRKERQLEIRSLAFDIASGIGLSSIPGLKLEIVPGMDYGRYRLKLQESAFAIDSYPFTGCNSMHDLLYSGVPAVSLEGKAWRSKIGPALLARAGLGYLVTQDVDQFRQTIVGLLLSSDVRARARGDLAAADLDARLAPTAADVGQWRAAFQLALQRSDASRMNGAPSHNAAYYEHYTVELSDEGDLQDGPAPEDTMGD